MKTKKPIQIRLSVFIFVLIAAMLATLMTSCGFNSNFGQGLLGGGGIYKYNDVTETDENGNVYDPIDSETIDKLELMIYLLDMYSYFGVDSDDICYALIHGFSAVTGDRYAEYYDEEAFELLTADNTGESQGVGISIIENTEHKCIEIINVMPNSPALKAGVEPGDLITHVGVGDNKVAVSSVGYQPAIAMLQGEKGTVCSFTVARGDRVLEFNITRDVFTSSSVTHHVCETDSKVGIIKLTEFDLTTPTQFCASMDALIAEGCEYFLFDVRYNGGGDLASISAVLSYMLNEGDIIIRTKDNKGKEETTTVKEVKREGDYAGCSVTKEDIGKYASYVRGKSAVLCNGSTASAAELFTSALMDYEVAVAVGTKTYGKGSMQSIIDLSYYGYGGGLKMTTKLYFPPLSEGYDGIGIFPDHAVELDPALADKNIYTIKDAEDNQIQAAISAIKK